MEILTRDICPACEGTRKILGSDGDYGKCIVCTNGYMEVWQSFEALFDMYSRRKLNFYR